MGCGKTSLARILTAATVCEDRPPHDVNPCGREGCVCVRVMRDPILFGRGATRRNCADLSLEKVKADYEELLYVHDETRPRVLLYDELHRLPVRAQEYLLTALEEDWGNFVHIMTSYDLSEIQPGLIKRLAPIEITPPTEDEAVRHLKEISDTEAFPFSTDILRQICRDQENVPRDYINALFTRAAMERIHKPSIP